MKRITITIDMHDVPACSHTTLIDLLHLLKGPFEDAHITIGYQDVVSTQRPRLCSECRGSGYKGGVGAQHFVQGEPNPICPTCAGSGRARKTV